MSLWVLFGFACIAIIALNVAGTRTVLRSRLDSKNKKYFYLTLIWLVPIFGVILVSLLINNDMKKIKNKNDEVLVDALNDFAKRVNTISDKIKKERKNNDNTLH